MEIWNAYNAGDIERAKAAQDKASEATMIVRNAGVVLSSRIGSAAEAQLRGLAMISLRIPSGARIRYIDSHAAEELQTWDAEIYRKKLDEDRSQES